jgi:membrane protease YdiL (CAAX protease family)
MALLSSTSDNPAAQEAGTVVIPQYTPARVLAVWAAAALPMGALAWGVAPVLGRQLDGPTAFPRALILALTAGLLWQCVLVLAVVRREQGTLRWSVLREALWLRAPASPRSGRRGGRVWWVLLPMAVLFAAEELIPVLPHPLTHDFSSLITSHAGRALFSGGVVWPAIVLVQMILNTALGEELLFRGLLLPRMRGAFGRWDWVANGLLFAAYHLHQPWSMPATLCDTFILGYPARRYRSSVLSILVHSTQTLFFAVAATALFVS